MRTLQANTRRRRLRGVVAVTRRRVFCRTLKNKSGSQTPSHKLTLGLTSEMATRIPMDFKRP